MAEATGYFDYLRTYAAAMPRAYRIRYDAFSVADHARIAFERNKRNVNAGTFRAPTGGATPLCIVGDDHSSIVSALSRATVLTRFDVVGGEAYTLDPRLERGSVVALFWVRRAGSKRGALRDEEALLLVDLIVAIGNRNASARRAVLGDLRKLHRSKVGTRDSRPLINAIKKRAAVPSTTWKLVNT
jgi:hypothetical protein